MIVCALSHLKRSTSSAHDECFLAQRLSAVKSSDSSSSAIMLDCSISDPCGLPYASGDRLEAITLSMADAQHGKLR
jgi:hypothetical protein